MVNKGGNMNQAIFENASKGLCVMCGEPVVKGRMTCSKKCHEEFIIFGEKKFGVMKKVVDSTTGITYQVPTRDIIEKGLAWEDLAKYSIWEDNKDNQ